MDIKQQIISYIKRNRVSTTEIADCLGKKGAIKNVSAINRTLFKVGTVCWVYAKDESNWTVHEQIRRCKENEIVFIEPFNCGNRAIIGELVSKYLLLYKQAAAIVVMGKVRDAHKLIKENYAIWSEGFNPEGCFNTQIEELDKEIYNKKMFTYNGSIAVCDDCGVVVIPQELHTNEFLKKLEDIETQEDIWFDCLDRRKMDTYDIVCLGKYNNFEDQNNE